MTDVRLLVPTLVHDGYCIYTAKCLSRVRL
jgi:hypothetical protein